MEAKIKIKKIKQPILIPKTIKAKIENGFGNIFGNMIGNGPKPMISKDMKEIINSIGGYLENPKKRIKELHKDVRITNKKIKKEIKKVKKKNKLNNNRIRIRRKE